MMPTAFYRFTAVLSASLLVTSAGCRSYISYAPRPLDDTAHAKKAIYEVLDQSRPSGRPAISM